MEGCATQVGDGGLLASDLDHLALDGAPNRQVDDRGRDELAAAVAERVDADLDGDLGPVLPAPDRVGTVHLGRQVHRAGLDPWPIGTLAGQDGADVGAGDGIGLVPEELAETGVRELDPARLVDDDERVGRSLDDGAEPLLRAADHVLVGQENADLARDGRGADDGAVALRDRGDRQSDADRASIAGEADRLVALDALAATESAEQLRRVVRLARGREAPHARADDLVRPVAEQALCGGVPARDRPVEGVTEDRVIGRPDDRGQQPLVGWIGGHVRELRLDSTQGERPGDPRSESERRSSSRIATCTRAITDASRISPARDVAPRHRGPRPVPAMARSRVMGFRLNLGER